MSQPTAPTPAAPRKRPFTLKALNALLLLRGAFYVFSFFVLLMPSETVAETITPMTLIEEGAVALFMGVLNLALAFGMWRLQPWAWRLTIITAGMLLIIDMWSFFGGERELLRTAGLLINVMIVFYLAQSDVRRLFAASLPGDAPPDAPETAHSEQL